MVDMFAHTVNQQAINVFIAMSRTVRNNAIPSKSVLNFNCNYPIDKLLKMCSYFLNHVSYLCTYVCYKIVFMCLSSCG